MWGGSYHRGSAGGQQWSSTCAGLAQALSLARPVVQGPGLMASACPACTLLPALLAVTLAAPEGSGGWAGLGNCLLQREVTRGHHPTAG